MASGEGEMVDGADNGLLMNPNWGPANEGACRNTLWAKVLHVVLYYTVCLGKKRIRVGGRIREENSVEEKSERNWRRGRGEGRLKWEIVGFFFFFLQFFHSSVPKYAHWDLKREFHEFSLQLQEIVSKRPRQLFSGVWIVVPLSWHHCASQNPSLLSV